MGKLNLTPQQQEVVINRGGNLLVSAAAGSGKTRVLVERLFRYILEEGRHIDEFLIITYTRAAAAELRSRIAEDLAKRLGEDPGNYHLQQQLYRIYRADIKTVDAFCSGLLRENVHLLPTVREESLTADFRVMDEGEADLLSRRVLRRVLENFYQAMEEGSVPGGKLLADAFGFGRDDRDLEDLVLQMSGKLQSHAYPRRWLEQAIANWEQLPDCLDDTVYAPLLLHRLRRKVEHWISVLAESVEEMAGDEKLQAAYATPFLQRVQELKQLSEDIKGGWDKVCGRRLESIRLGAVRKPQDVYLKNRVKAQWDASKKELEKALSAFDLTSEEALEDLQAVAPAMSALLRLTAAFEEELTAEKVKNNLTDFSDQEHYAIQLLLGGDGEPTELCSRIAARYAEIMVDEYQDTNEVQNCIFEALSKEKHNLFTVGDVKQSIYRFRLADPTIFLRKYRAFRDAEEAKAGEDRRILLSKNFRSRREVLDAANFVFEQIMSPEMGEMAYGAEERLYLGAENFPEREDTATEYHLITMPSAERGIQGPDLHDVEANFVASRIEEMLSTGYPVTDDRTGELRPCVPSDFAILMRSPSGNLMRYVRALQGRNIPCASQENDDFFSAMEIAVTYSLLRLIDNPCQDVPLVSVLRSPVFGYTPDRLASIRSACPKGAFWEAVEQAAQRGEEDVAAFQNAIADLRNLSRDIPIHQLIWNLYDAFHLPAVFGAMEGGTLRRGNLMTLYENACAFEAAGYRGLFAYVAHLRDLMESGKQPAASVGSGADGVQIMSIHKSKGLEFPIVILADLNKSFNKQDQRAPVLVHPIYGLGPKRVDLDRRITYPTVARGAIEYTISRESLSEEMRVLYVAMTRPKEKLIMVSTMRNPQTRLARLAAAVDCPVPPNAVEGASCLGDWVLLALMGRPEAGCLWELGEVEPKTLAAPEGTPWKVAVHSGDDYTQTARRRHREEVDTAEPLVFDTDLLDYVYPYSKATVLPTKVTATQLKGREKDQQIAEGTAPSYDQSRPLCRPAFLSGGQAVITGAERGTAVHAVMQYLDLNCSDVAGAVQDLVERGFLTPRQGESIDCRMIETFLQSSLCQEMRQAKKLWREYCFSLLVPGEQVIGDRAKGEEVLLQGVVDCFYETEDGLVVVDFKTDRVSGSDQAARTEIYRSQVEAYSNALSRIFQKKVCRRILYYFYTGTTVEL